MAKREHMITHSRSAGKDIGTRKLAKKEAKEGAHVHVEGIGSQKWCSKSEPCSGYKPLKEY